jgi:hypothetical protein
MDNPKGRGVFLANHGDDALSGREEVVCGVVCMRGTNLALTLEAQQHRFEAAGRYRHLVGAHVGVGAV